MNFSVRIQYMSYADDMKCDNGNECYIFMTNVEQINKVCHV